MHRTLLISTLSLTLLACADDTNSDSTGSGAGGDGPVAVGGAGGEPGQGAGGEGGSSNGGAGGGTSSGGGGAGGAPITYEVAVGAAFPNQADGRVLLIDPTGTRSVLFNPSTGTFDSADDIDELFGGLPIANVIAAGRVDDETYLFDAAGEVAIYDHDQATFSAPEPLQDALDDAPFAAVGASFGLGAQLFVFNEAGTSYAAYNTTSETWSPVYSFLADFGGGGAPLPSVGAAYAAPDGSVTLFDQAGTSYAVYLGGGEFSDDFDIEELGNGGLTFDDVDDD